MNKKTIILFVTFLFSLLTRAQEPNMNQPWSLSDCIDYALNQNIQVRQSILTNLSNEVYKEQAEAQVLPSVNASVRQNFSWSKIGSVDDDANFSGTNSTSYSVSSSITLYSGSRLKNLIKQAELDMQAGIYNSETIKESVSLSILNAYLQVLFADERVKNAERQIESTTQQLNLAEERMNLGIISRSDYLQVKSQLATEQLNLANARSQYAISRVNLMQLMELPVNEDFTILEPEIGDAINQNLMPQPENVFAVALEIKPQVQTAQLNTESAALNEEIATAGYYPVISADAGLGTNYSNRSEEAYFGQLNDQISPSVGISMSIPIFQKKQAQTSVSLAKINYENAELREIDTKNQLRKEVEQVCVDVVSAQTEYEASTERYNSILESYNLAEERFNNGLINSVDFLYERTNFIVAESELLQAKFNLIFNYKILDFYLGNPITF